jgi:hypothetical protein
MPSRVDYVRRDGRVAERELQPEDPRLGTASHLQVPIGPLDELLDAYSVHERRSQVCLCARPRGRVPASRLRTVPSCCDARAH